MKIAPGRQDGRCAQQVTAWRGSDEAAIECMQYRIHFMVIAQQLVGAFQFLKDGKRFLIGNDGCGFECGLRRHAPDQRFDGDL